MGKVFKWIFFAIVLAIIFLLAKYFLDRRERLKSVGTNFQNGNFTFKSPFGIQKENIDAFSTSGETILSENDKFQLGLRKQSGEIIEVFLVHKKESSPVTLELLTIDFERNSTLYQKKMQE